MITPFVRCDELGNREIRWNGLCRHCEHRNPLPCTHPMDAQQVAEQCPCRSLYTLTAAASRMLSEAKTSRGCDEPCPGCDQTTSLRWVDNTEDTDTWSCQECGTEWTITVDGPASAVADPVQ